MFRFFKSKEKESPPPTQQPQANHPDPSPSEPVKSEGISASSQASQVPSSSSQKPVDAPSVTKIVPRQGSIAAALKAATAPASTHASPNQSAIFRPKVSVIIKPGSAPVAAPASDATASPVLSQGSDLPEFINFPTKELLTLLPEHALIEDAANHSALPLHISIPAQEVVSQLSKGRVQVPITLLVALIPKEIMAPSFSATEDVKIKLPLHLILPQLPESVMSLPSGQAKQEVDPNLASPFSERGRGGNAQKMKSSIVSIATPKVNTPPSIPSVKPSTLAAPALDLNPANAAKMSQNIGLPLKPVILPKPSVIPKPLSGVSAPSKEIPPAASPVIPPINLGVPAITPPVESKPPAKESDLNIAKPLPSPVIPAPSILPASDEQKSPIISSVIPPSEELLEKKNDDASKNLAEWLGISEKDVKLPELAQKVKDKLKIDGVLIATKDGLPLVTAMPEPFDVNSWSGFAGDLFKKFGADGHSLSGSPRKYLLSLGSLWISAYDEKGIYLFLVHQGDVLTPEFEEQGFKLAKNLSRFATNRREMNS